MLSDYPIYAGIPVTDLDKAVDWYREKLGFQPSSDPPIEANSEGLFLDAGRGTRFFLYRTRSHPGSGHTLAEFAVGEDIDAVVAELRGRGVAFEEYDFPGLRTEGGIASVADEQGRGAHRVAFFKDVEGNVLAIGSYGRGKES